MKILKGKLRCKILGHSKYVEINIFSHKKCHVYCYECGKRLKVNVNTSEVDRKIVKSIMITTNLMHQYISGNFKL